MGTPPAPFDLGELPEARQKGTFERCLVVHLATENYVAVSLAMVPLLQPGVVVSQTAPRMSMHTPGTHGPTLSMNPVRVGVSKVPFFRASGSSPKPKGAGGVPTGDSHVFSGA